MFTNLRISYGIWQIKDAIKRYSYLLGQTDLFKHFVDMKVRFQTFVAFRGTHRRTESSPTHANFLFPFPFPTTSAHRRGYQYRVWYCEYCWRQGVTQYVFERARGSPSPVTVLTSPVCTRHPLPFSHRVRFPISILNLRYSFLGLFLVISRGLRSVYKRRGYSPDITILHPTIHTVKFTQSLLPANLALSLHHDHGPGTSSLHRAKR